MSKEKSEQTQFRNVLGISALKVENPKIIPNGTYKGIIKAVEQRDVFGQDGITYNYVDVIFGIEIEGEERELKLGFPWRLSFITSLGKFLTTMRFELIEDAIVSIEQIRKYLVGKIAVFRVSQNETGFTQIVAKSIRYVNDGEKKK